MPKKDIQNNSEDISLNDKAALDAMAKQAVVADTTEVTVDPVIPIAPVVTPN